MLRGNGLRRRAAGNEVKNCRIFDRRRPVHTSRREAKIASFRGDWARRSNLQSRDAKKNYPVKSRSKAWRKSVREAVEASDRFDGHAIQIPPVPHPERVAVLYSICLAGLRRERKSHAIVVNRNNG